MSNKYSLRWIKGGVNMKYLFSWINFSYDWPESCGCRGTAKDEKIC